MAKTLNIPAIARWLLTKHPPAAWLILALTLMVTCWAWYVSAKAVSQTIETRFDYQAQDLATAITDRMKEYELALRSGAALFDASSSVTRKDWSSFTDTIYLQKYFPGIQALGYSVMLTPEEVEAHTDAIRAEGFNDYRITPEGERAQYSAIQFIEPFDWRNQRAFGFDMYSNPIRREAMDRARDTGQPATSGRVTLVQETDKDVQYGFLMYYPVYRKNMPLDYIEERRRALKSFVYAAFRMHDLMSGILGQAQGELEFGVYDGASASADTVLYNSNPTQPAAGSVTGSSQFNGYYPLEIAGRSWTLHVYSADGFVAFSEKHQPTFIVIAGVLLDICLFYLISYLAKSRKQARESAVSAQTERDLTEQRLHLAAEAGNMGLAEWNLIDNKLIWDQRMLDLYGYTANEFSGDVKAWSSRLHPDDIEQAIAAVEHAKRFSNRFDMAFRIILPDQTVRYLMACVVVERDLADNPVRMVGFNYDVTEQREAELKLNERNWHLQNVLEAANAGTWEWDVNTGSIGVNERWANIIGYTFAEIQPVTLTSWQAYIHPEDRERFEQELQRYFDRKVNYYACSLRLQHRDGHWVWVMTRGKVFSWDDKGNPLQMFGTIQDISEQKDQEALLEQERDKADRANRSRGEFLANMSHEIRTPINGVIGALNLLSDTSLTASQQNLITISKRSADSLLGLINDILDLSKIESGKLQIIEEEVELSGLLSDTALMLATRAETKGLTLLCPSHYLPTMNVMVDGLRLRQIMTNLLNNAIKFTDKGQVSVDVEVLAESRGQVRLRFNVRDTGQGISQEKQATLFRRFEQVDNSLTRREGGTGLGLAICKQLVSMMQGKIGLESELGKGSTFWFELELDRASRYSKQTASSVFDDLTVLTVQPAALYHSYYDSLFEAWGITHDVVKDVATAVETLESLNAGYQVLLLDAERLKHSQLKALKTLCEQRKTITVIVTCPQSMLTAVPQPISDVADMIVSKPVVQSALFNALLAVVKDDLDSQEALVNTVSYSDFNADILVVEDNPTNVAIVSGLLRKFGVNVSLAENGLQALDMLARERYDLVLMDCQMPELDGYEATRRIRQNGTVLDASVPVIALTAHAMREDEQKCLDAGMNDYLTKPIDPYLLNKTLAEWLPQQCLKKIAS